MLQPIPYFLENPEFYYHDKKKETIFNKQKRQ